MTRAFPRTLVSTGMSYSHLCTPKPKTGATTGLNPDCGLLSSIERPRADPGVPTATRRRARRGPEPCAFVVRFALTHSDCDDHFRGLTIATAIGSGGVPSPGLWRC
eukprot:7377146-Prymnesium_polylepis.2